MENKVVPLASMMLNEKERNLIEYCRKMEYGKLIIYVKGSQPIRVEVALKSIEL